MSWLPKSTILVPVDFSADCVEAAKTALELTDQPSGVHVLHVLVPLLPATYYGIGHGLPTPPDEEIREKAARNHLEQYVKQNGLEGVTTALRAGKAGEGIAEYAQEVKADLIVMPSHGYHGISRVLLGSVAERVLRLATCPVLVLRRMDGD